MGLGKFLKKGFSQVNFNPVKHGLQLFQGIGRTIRTGDTHYITDTVREHGRSEFLGLRTREVAGAAALVYGGYAAYGAYAGGAASTGQAVAAGGSTLGGAGGVSGASAAATGGGAVTVGSAAAGGTGWLATLGQVAGPALLLAKRLGINIGGPGQPEYAPETIPSENFYPAGLLDKIYPGYKELSGTPLNLSDGMNSDGAGFLGNFARNPMLLFWMAILFIGGFLLIRFIRR